MRGELRDNTLSGLGDKPEWIQFSGITCNDRRRMREERKWKHRQKGKRRVKLMWK